MESARRVRLKSRKGCAQCKRRKVKCDEQYPTCRNCKRFGDKCEYQTLPAPEPTLSSASGSMSSRSAPTAASSSTAASSPHHGGEPSPAYSIVASPPVTRRVELELMHHFTAFTSLTLFDIEEKRAVFQRYAPKLALDKSYLMHAIFAVTAMHIADSLIATDTKKGTQYHELSATHHGRALADLPADLEVRVEKDYEPIFAFSGLLAIYSFTMAWQNVKRFPDEDVLPTMVSWFSTTKGVESVVWKTGVADRIMAGKFEVLFRGYDPPSAEEVPLSNEVTSQLDGLASFAEWHERSKRPASDLSESASDLTEAYSEALEYLRHAYRKLGAPLGKYCRVSSIMAWPVQISPLLFTAMAESKTPALLLAMQFFVVMHRLKSYWWIGEGPAIMCRSLAAMIPSEFRPWTKWPLDAVSR